MKVGIILTVSAWVAFILTAIYTNSFWLSILAAYISLFSTASIIWKIDLGTWNFLND